MAHYARWHLPTNSVAERFNRTLKEQAIYGHAFRRIAHVRRVVADFVERYDAHWHLGKLGFKKARQTAPLEQAA